MSQLIESWTPLRGGKDFCQGIPVCAVFLPWHAAPYERHWRRSMGVRDPECAKRVRLSCVGLLGFLLCSRVDVVRRMGHETILYCEHSALT